MSNVLEINSLSDLAPWATLWDELFRQTPGAALFQHRRWLQSYWRHFGRGQRLRIVIAPEGPRPGIVPLVVRREPTRIGPVRVLTYPLQDWGSFYGPIGPDPPAALASALAQVHRTPRDWDLLDLRWIPEERLAGLAEAASSAGFAMRRGVWARIAMVDLSGTWEEYFARRTGKFRNHVRRCQKRAAGLGNVVYERFRPAADHAASNDPRLDLYDACVEVARRSWQGDSQTGTTLSHAEVAPFLRQMHVLAAHTGMLDLSLLRVSGRPVAFAYNYHWNGYVLGLRAGYDRELSAAGIGHVLFAAMIRDSFARGDRTFDLGPLYFEAKRPWTTHLAPVGRLTHYPLTRPRTQVLRLKHWVAGLGS